MKKNETAKKAALIVAAGVGFGLVASVAMGGIYTVAGINSLFGEEAGSKMVEIFMAAGKKAILDKK